MRISKRTGDRGYCNPMFWDVIVRLDGKPVDYCLVADSDDGYVVRAILHSGTGKPLFNPISETYEMETVYGRVSIQRMPTDRDTTAMGNACKRTQP